MSIKDADKNTLKIAKVMDHLAIDPLSDLPRMMKRGWLGSANDTWDGGTDLMYVTFKHYYNCKDALDLNLDTDYTPVPWAAIPALINISKAHFRAETERSRCVASDPLQRTIDKNLAEDLADSTPFLFFVDDWGEDDDLSIHCCNIDAWDEIMHFQNDLIDTLVGTKANNRDIDCEMYIGIHDEETTKVSPAYTNYEDWKEAVLTSLQDLETKEYSPICIQMARDSDGDMCRIIYWIAKVVEEEEDDD